MDAYNSFALFLFHSHLADLCFPICYIRYVWICVRVKFTYAHMHVRLFVRLYVCVRWWCFVYVCCVAKRGYLICLALTNNSRHMHTECNGRILLFVAYFVFLFWVLVFFIISALRVWIHCTREFHRSIRLFSHQSLFLLLLLLVVCVYFVLRSKIIFYCVLLRHRRFTTAHRLLLLLFLLCYVIVLCSAVCPIRWKRKFHFNNILWIPLHRSKSIHELCDQMFCVSNVRQKKVTKIHTHEEMNSVFELDWIWFGCWCVYWSQNFVSYAAVTAIYFQKKIQRNETKRKWRIVCESAGTIVCIHLSEKQFVQHWKRKEKEEKNSRIFGLTQCVCVCLELRWKRRWKERKRFSCMVEFNSM